MRERLQVGRFLRRYKRFFADVERGSETLVTHCPNTGSMKTLLAEGVEAWFRTSDDPRRKLAHSLVLLGVPGGVALVDTALPNRIVAEALEAEVVGSLAGYGSVRREVKVGEKSRIDVVLGDHREGRPDCYIEIKNVTMLSGETPDTVTAGRRRADFPDAVTSRGTRHLEELMRLVDQGHRAVQLYFLGRTDCDLVGLASTIDPVYAETARAAQARGVEFRAVALRAERGDEDWALTVGAELPVVL